MIENWKIPLYKIYTDDEAILLVNRVIKRDNGWAIGPEIEEYKNVKIKANTSDKIETKI